MNLHEALGVAIDYEIKVRDHYAAGAKAIADPAGRGVFELLAREEQSHVDHLTGALQALKREGRVPRTPLASVLPKGVAWIDSARERLQARPGERIASSSELELVKVALRLEQETGAFYRDLVKQLPEEDRSVFEAFLETEEGHELLVQSQLDSLTGIGFWFDVMEFRLENG